MFLITKTASWNPNTSHLNWPVGKRRRLITNTAIQLPRRQEQHRKKALCLRGCEERKRGYLISWKGTMENKSRILVLLSPFVDKAVVIIITLKKDVLLILNLFQKRKHEHSYIFSVSFVKVKKTHFFKLCFYGLIFERSNSLYHFWKVQVLLLFRCRNCRNGWLRFCLSFQSPSTHTNHQHD